MTRSWAVLGRRSLVAPTSYYAMIAFSVSYRLQCPDCYSQVVVLMGVGNLLYFLSLTNPANFKEITK